MLGAPQSPRRDDGCLQLQQREVGPDGSVAMTPSSSKAGHLGRVPRKFFQVFDRVEELQSFGVSRQGSATAAHDIMPAPEENAGAKFLWHFFSRYPVC